VLEIRRSQTAVISCRDEAMVLNGMPQWDGIFPGRVAPDELLLIGPASAKNELLQDASQHLRQAGAFGVAVNMSDAWTVWTIIGQEADHVWAMLSQNSIPKERPAFVQGAVASVPGKAIILNSTIHVLTPSPLGHHLPHRILQAGREFDPHLVEPSEFMLDPFLTGATR
jgi:hypothetical protein